MAIQEAGEAFLVGLLEQVNLCAFPCKACYYYAKGYSAGETYPGGYLITLGARENNKCKKIF